MKYLKRTLVFTALLGIIFYSYHNETRIEELQKGVNDLVTVNYNLYEISQELHNRTKKPSYEYLKSVTVRVSGMDTETNRQWSGTGVVVKIEENSAYILTNAHVAGNDFINPELFIYDGLGMVRAEIIKYHDNVDLAIIRVNRKLFDKQAVKGFAQAKPQDRVFLTGHHLGRQYIYGEGVFAGYQGNYSLVQIPTMFGNSGSGVINQDGKLVSMVFAINSVGFTFIHTHGLSVDYLDIISFLKKHNIK